MQSDICSVDNLCQMSNLVKLSETTDSLPVCLYQRCQLIFFPETLNKNNFFSQIE